MPRNYLSDPDLLFLQQVTNKDLRELVSYLTRSRTEELTSQEEYHRHADNYHEYILEIIHELQLYGGNTFANTLRGMVEADFNPFERICTDLICGPIFLPFGKTTADTATPELGRYKQGVPYEKVLHLACKRMNINVPRHISVETKETALLETIARRGIENMTIDGLRRIVETSTNKRTVATDKGQLVTAAQLAIKASGFGPLESTEFQPVSQP